MRRLHLFEWEDLSWFPHLWRNYMTDVLQFTLTLAAPRAPVIREQLSRLLDRAATDEIVDLCSGSSGPLLWFREQLEQERGRPLTVLLTDKYPNLAKFEELAHGSDGRVRFRSDPIDATAVPPELAGLRTLFAAFHHFRPETAQRILADAAEKRRGIAVFEGSERSAKAMALLLLTAPLVVWLATPFIRPFRWSRLFWTYALPVVPLAVWWDGLVSCLRTYTPVELEQLGAATGAKNYQWEAGTGRIQGTLARVTYLVGWPT